jgi:hypothetical protein
MKNRLIIFLVLIHLSVFAYNNFTMPIEIVKGSHKLQKDIDLMEEKAINHLHFTKEDKNFLKLFYNSLTFGGYFQSKTRSASKLMKRYLSCSGKDYKIKPNIFLKNVKVQKKMEKMLDDFFIDYAEGKHKSLYESKTFSMQDESSPASEYALYKGKIKLIIKKKTTKKIVVVWRFENPWCWSTYEEIFRKYNNYHAESFPICVKKCIYVDNGLGGHLVQLGLAKPFLVFAEHEVEYTASGTRGMFIPQNNEKDN